MQRLTKQLVAAMIGLRERTNPAMPFGELSAQHSMLRKRGLAQGHNQNCMLTPAGEQALNDHHSNLKKGH